ncbi:MAG TPA: Dyp-type peroxidase [Bryobacteraceae bacterium]|jgi:deferrochelatase/peroxidase EfeB
MNRTHTSRRSAFALCFAVLAVDLAAVRLAAQPVAKAAVDAAMPSWKRPQDPNKAEPFWGDHQGGILTPPQHHLYFAAFDLITTNREDVVKLMQAWTAAAARMTQGQTAQPMEGGLKLAVPRPPADPNKDEDAYGFPDPGATPADTGETMGMSAARLTISFGFGPGLFIKDGKDRYGLASRRPAAFVDLPKFAGDQMVEGHTGGDLAIQACAEDPQVAFHAVRQLARIAEGVAQIRWAQVGYRPATGERHLLGFSNGKGNPSPDDPEAMDQAVWAGKEGGWMRGGTYVVVRRIRFAVEHWDHMPQAYQEKAVGETKHPGMPAGVGGGPPADMPEDENAQTHLKIVTPGALTILRRSYSYNDGVNFTAERWPPWRQGLEYDAGMFFISYQRDPRTGFIALFDKLAKYDAMLNQFWTHEGGGLFAYPRGARSGEYIGQPLFESR